MDTKFATEKMVSDYEKDFKSKESQYAADVNTAQAESSLAYDLQARVTK